MNQRLRFSLAGSLLLFAVTLIGCTAMHRMPVADEVVPHGEDADLDTLRQGRAIVVSECVGCHRTYWPGEFSPRQWNDIAQNMSNRVGLTTPQSQAVRSYLMAAARTEASLR